MEQVPVRWSTIVDPGVAALADATERLRSTLPPDLGDRRDDITLVAEALLENAAVHGAPPIHLTFRADDRVVLVEDSVGSSRLPRLHLAPAVGYRLRRGLAVIERLADRLDMRLLANGKVIRAVFEQEARPGTDR
jgi:hypothetical protein